MFQGQASLLNCQTTTGEITILDNHEALITVLASGTIKIIENPSAGSGQAKDQFFPVKSGFLEVKAGNEVRVIVEQ